MEEHSSGHVTDCLDGTFSDCVLMMSTGAGAGLRLSGFTKVGFPGSGGKDAVISVIGTGGDTTLSDVSFEAVLTGKSFVSVERDLMIDLDEARRSIMKDGSALVLLGDTFLSEGIWETGADIGFVLVDVNALARPKGVSLEDIEALGVLLGVTGGGRSTFSFGGGAGDT